MCADDTCPPNWLSQLNFRGCGRDKNTSKFQLSDFFQTERHRLPPSSRGLWTPAARPHVLVASDQTASQAWACRRLQTCHLSSHTPYAAHCVVVSHTQGFVFCSLRVSFVQHNFPDMLYALRHSLLRGGAAPRSEAKVSWSPPGGRLQCR